MSEWDDLTDDELLALLSEAVAEGEAVAERRRDAARGAFAWRDVDVELAQLLHDSALDAGAAVRSSGTAVRTLSFGAGELSLELEIDGEQVLGEVVGRLGPTTVTLQRPEVDDVVVEVDESGFFRVPDVGAGPARLVVTAPGGGLTTPWMTL